MRDSRRDGDKREEHELEGDKKAGMIEEQSEEQTFRKAKETSSSRVNDESNFVADDTVNVIKMPGEGRPVTTGEA